VAGVVDALDRAAPVPAPEPPPEEAPAVGLPDSEAAVEDAVPVAGKFTAPEGLARLVPPTGLRAAFCAAAGAANTPASSNARCSGLVMKLRPLRQFLPTTQLW
jgi:hypothetical protein